MKPLLSVQDLTLYFPDNEQIIYALQGINFTLYQGETLGIVGESGCGKSALAKTLAGLIQEERGVVEKGTVLFKQKNLLLQSPAEWRKTRAKDIGIIFQDPMGSLNPTLTIGFQLKESLLQYNPHLSEKECYLEMQEILQEVGIPSSRSILQEFPSSLSGGLKQRILIALSLCRHPELLIGDEITTALDVTIQAQILELLEKIQKNKTMLLITHDLGVAARLCDRIIIMYAGKIVEEASVFDLFSSPSHPYTQGLLQALPSWGGKKKSALIPIMGTPPLLRVDRKSVV